MFFGEGVIDSPPRLEVSVGTAAADGPVFHSRELKLRIGMVAQGIVTSNFLLGMSTDNSHQKSERHTSYGFQSCLPAKLHMKKEHSSLLNISVPRTRSKKFL